MLKIIDENISIFFDLLTLIYKIMRNDPHESGGFKCSTK